MKRLHSRLRFACAGGRPRSNALLAGLFVCCCCLVLIIAGLRRRGFSLRADAPMADATRADAPRAEAPLAEAPRLNLSDLAAGQAAVREMTRFAWRSYVDYCGRQGGNDLAPLTNSCHPVPDGLVGPRQLLTVVDSLDTLALMGLRDELAEARNLLVRLFQPRQSTGFLANVFETSIRLLGGFLGAHSLTGDRMYVEFAAEVADSLAGAFASPDRMVHSRAKLFDSQAAEAAPNNLVLAEVGSLYLEFTHLSHITGNGKYAEWARRNQELLMRVPTMCGLHPSIFGPKGEPLGSVRYTAGSGSDSFYEYLVKRCLLDSQPEPSCNGTYAAALDNIARRLSVRVGAAGYVCSVSVSNPCQVASAECDMEHLTCFIGGTFALAYMQNPSRKDWLQFAEQITGTCYASYAHSPTGLGPDRFKFDNVTQKLVAYPGSDYYVLRPETVESIYYLYYVTGNQTYLDWGWRIAQTLNATARTAHGFSGVRGMASGKPEFDNQQQSFFLAETLKYLYLLFSPPSALPLDQWLFSTEAHVLPTRDNPMRKRPLHG